MIQAIRKKNPNTVIIGTSSLSLGELRGFEAPDYVMDKVNDAEVDLDRICTKLYK